MKRTHALCLPGYSKDTKSPEMKQVACNLEARNKIKNNRYTKRESLVNPLYVSIPPAPLNPSKVTTFSKVSARRKN